MTLAGRLAPGGGAGVAWFDVVGRVVGLHPEGVEASSVTRGQTFGLLALAAGVFGSEVPTLAQVADLRVLAGVARGPGAEAQATAADLARLVRWGRGPAAQPAGTPRPHPR